VFRLRHGSAGDLGLIGVELVVGLFLLWSSRSKWLDRRLTQLIWRLLHRFSRLSKRDVETLVALVDHESL
jgi:hypothetical protein